MVPEGVRILLSRGGDFIAPYSKINMEDLVELINNVQNLWGETGIPEKIMNNNKLKSSIIREMMKKKSYKPEEHHTVEMILQLE